MACQRWCVCVCDKVGCERGCVKDGCGAVSATPATQNEGGCHQVPRLPHKTKVDVAKCHACHAKCRGVTGDQSSPSAPPEPAQCRKCHAYHAKRRWMSPSATPAKQNKGGCHQAPRLPCKTKVDVAKCHACHVKAT